MISSALVGVVAQRLMRKVCEHCATVMPVSEEEHGIVPDDILMIKHPTGCNRCNNTGYKGRIAIHEILGIDGEIRRMITAGASVDEVTQYALHEQGVMTLREQALDLVRRGITTVEELLKVAYYA